jgi:hypothetical protein
VRLDVAAVHRLRALLVLQREVAEITGALEVSRVERVQVLWGGYGEILRAYLVGVGAPSVIVKWVRLPSGDANSGVSDARKRRSYAAEAAFYRAFAPRGDGACRVATLLGERVTHDQRILVLEDLDAAGYDRRHHDPRGRELDACLRWLATFHARFLGQAPDGLWETGTYWHLATRAAELEATRDEEVRTRAPIVDRALNAAHFRTIVHGDAKPDNFCFSRDGERVAAVDFQYVGGGCGTKDVAYLLYGAPRDVEAHGLETYFASLRAALPEAVDRAALEREWRDLYPLACEDFRRFLAGWRTG